MVDSLQNTKYSIDEKLEKSFINLFSKKPISSVPEEPSDTEDNQETVEHTIKIAKAHQYQSGEEPQTDDSSDDDEDDNMKCLKYSDEGRTFQKESTLKTVDSCSDEEHINAIEDSLLENKVSEHVEFRNGRMRRKAVFGNELDLGDEVMYCFSNFMMTLFVLSFLF